MNLFADLVIDECPDGWGLVGERAGGEAQRMRKQGHCYALKIIQQLVGVHDGR